MSINPYYWLAARRKWRSGRVWLVLTVICGVAALIASGLTDPTQFAPATLFFVLIGWHLMIKLLVADEMGRTLSADRASGALEFVLSTPLSVQEIVRGEWLALWKVFRWPVAIFLALAAGGLVMILTRTAPQWIGNYSVANIALLLTTCIILFGLDIIALGWVGIWMTMRHRKREHAPGSAVARVMALPSLIFLLLTIAWSGSDWFLPGANSNHAFLVNVAWWFAIGVAVDISFIWWSRRQLFRHFRVMATLEYANLGFGAWWGRRLGTAYARWRRARSNMPKQSAPC